MRLILILALAAVMVVFVVVFPYAAQASTPEDYNRYRQGYYSDINGGFKTHSTCVCTAADVRIPVDAGGEYYFTITGTEGLRYAALYFSDSMAFISCGPTYSISENVVHTVPAGASYVRFNVSRAAGGAMSASLITSTTVTRVGGEDSSSQPEDPGPSSSEDTSIPDSSSASEDDSTSTSTSEDDSTSTSTSEDDSGSGSEDSSGDSSSSTSRPPATPEDHPFLTTPFDDYNVTEGLLLVVVVIAVLSIIILVFRGR